MFYVDAPRVARLFFVYPDVEQQLIAENRLSEALAAKSFLQKAGRNLLKRGRSLTVF
jgi:hypothetical protein